MDDPNSRRCNPDVTLPIVPRLVLVAGARLAAAVLALGLPPPSSAGWGHGGGGDKGSSVRFQASSPIPRAALKEPVASRVYQRDRNGRADIPIVVGEKMENGAVVSAVVGHQSQTSPPIRG